MSRSFAVALTYVALTANGAWAFTISSVFSKPCHEPITMEALRNVRLINVAADPLTSSDRNDRALVDDLTFQLDRDMRDFGAVTLLIGVRDNDLKGRDLNELDSLALIHGDPLTQREHCLRGPKDDEPGGTDNALRECRGYIREMFADALDGLDAGGLPTLANRMDLLVGLSLRGRVNYPLPRFYVRMGQALHAVQDGFSHTYRPLDRAHVSVTLNYVDVVDGSYLASRDGPRHSAELDQCDAPDELRVRNRQLAVEASMAVLDLGLAPALSREQKLAALDVLLNKYFGFQSGCTESNLWCNAPETDIAAAKGCGCGASGGWSGLLALALMLIATRRFKRGPRRARVFSGLLLLCLAVPFSARAQTPTPTPTSTSTPDAVPAIDSPQAAATGAFVPISPDEVKAVQKEDMHRSLFSLYFATGGSIFNAAVIGVIGARVRLSDYWQLGLDAELNGWYGIQSQRMRTGSANIYLSVVLRFPLKYEQINLRSNLQLGIAIQMFDLPGVPTGSVGLYGGLNPLGIEFKLSGHLYLVIYPLGVAIPATQLKGAPFAFPQFRTTVGLEVSF